MSERKRTRMNLEAVAQFADLADYTFAFAARAIAAVGVADHLVDGPLRIEKLAARTGCDRNALLRVMRALVAKGVFIEEPAETFALGPVGEVLRTDHPLSMRWFFRHEPDVHAMAGLEYSLRTGKPAFNELFGANYFDWIARHDGARARFRDSQRALNRLELLALARAYPWAEARSVVDLGGNDGSLLAELLRRNPSLTGALFDLPENAADARRILEEAGVSDRAEILRGDLFQDGLPHGFDLYVIKRVLVGFSDAQAVSALSRVRAAMAKHSRLLVIEAMQNATDKLAVSLDVRMLVLGLGRVRTAKEFTALLAAAGLPAVKVRSAGLLTVIEAGVAPG